MSTAREQILAKIRRSTRQTASQADSKAIVDERLAQPARGPLPAFDEQPLKRFTARARKAAASVVNINHISEAGDAISSYLKEQALTQRITAAPSPLLNEISWPQGIEVETRNAEANDQVAVSVAWAGIAETGTLALLSGEDTPTTLNFLPDNYICLLRRADLVTHMEDVWDRIRAERDGMPRTLNFITGPSRTADVEQTIQLGAHGPRQLLVIVIER